MSDSRRGTEPPSPYPPMPSQQEPVDGEDEPSVLEQDYPDDPGAAPPLDERERAPARPPGPDARSSPEDGS